MFFIKKRSFAVYIVKMYKLHTKMFFTQKRSFALSKKFLTFLRRSFNKKKLFCRKEKSFVSFAENNLK